MLHNSQTALSLKTSIVIFFFHPPPSDLCPNNIGSDYGYFSSMEGSEMGSREGSDVACSEGMCNHEEAGWFRLKPVRAWKGNNPVFYGCVLVFHESCSSTWPCFLLHAGDDLQANQYAEDKEEDQTDGCVDHWPHYEVKLQCKSKKKKKKALNLCGNQVSEQTESQAVWGAFWVVWLSGCIF